nr:Uncharacterised protein [Klebsiella pneumoniae]
MITTLREQNITFLHGSPTILSFFAGLRVSRASTIPAIFRHCARLPAALAT